MHKTNHPAKHTAQENAERARSDTKSLACHASGQDAKTAVSVHTKTPQPRLVFSPAAVQTLLVVAGRTAQPARSPHVSSEASSSALSPLLLDGESAELPLQEKRAWDSILALPGTRARVHSHPETQG